MKTCTFLAVCAALLLTATAQAGIPDLDNSTATSNSGHIMITPNGTGPTLAEANVTITVTVIDGLGSPVPGYPFQDIWVFDTGTGELSICNGGSVADGNTNALGETTISGSIAGGGWTQNGLQVYLAGVAVTTPPLDITVASPDISGDLRVDIVDLGDFAIRYLNAQYDFRADFNGDGVEDLVDVGDFGIQNGTFCP